MDYAFKDLIDVRKLQELTDALYAASSIPSSVITMDGEILTGSGWQRICTDFHRRHPRTEKDCIESDTCIRKGIEDGEPFVIYRCPRGLVDASVPIVIEGEHVANVFSGQVFLAPPDASVERFFRKQAAAFGFDEAAYMQAFREVPVVTEARFRAGLSFLARLARAIAEMGLVRLNELQTIADLRQSEESLRALLNASMESVFLIDLDGKVITSNAVTARRLGVTVDELVGHCIYDYLPPAIAEARRQKVREVAATARPVRFEDERGEVVVDQTVYPVVDSTGQVVRAAIFGMDITQSRRSETALRESEARFRMLSDVTMEGIVILKDAVVKDINAALAKMIGYTREELIGRDILDLVVHPADRDVVLENIVKDYAEPYVIRAIRKDGETFQAEIEARNFRFMGETLRGAAVRDVTERMRAENALAASERKWRNILVNTPQIGVSIDGQGRIVFANNHFLQITGWSEDEALGQDWFDLCIPPEVHDEVRRVFRAVMDGGGELDLTTHENEILTKSGTRRNVAWSNVLTRDADGGIVDVTCLGIDLTERKQAERAIDSERVFLTAVFDNIEDAIIISDADGRLVRFNEAARRLHGIPEQPIPPEQWARHYDLYEEDGRTPLTMAKVPLFRALQGERVRDVEIVVAPKNRRPHSMVCSGQALTGRNGIPLGAVIAMHDITERKQSQLDLYRTQFTVDSSPLSIFWISPAGRFLFVNETAARRLQYTREEMLTLGVEDIDPNFPAATRDTQWQLYKTAGQANFESFHRRKDGTRIPVHVHSWYVEFMGQEMEVAEVEDISEYKQAEQEQERLHNQLVQAQKMESVGRLAGGVAHDFNNMLGVILGHVEMIIDALPTDSPIRGSLDEIWNAATRSANITRQLLAFARKQAIAPQVLDLNRTIDKMLSMLQRLIGEHIELVWRPGRGVWPVRIDPAQVDQVLANLCVNARDAIGNVGRIVIETTNRTLDEAPPEGRGDYVRLSVRDDGCGMDPQTLASLFEPFFTTKGVDQGTGLGLAMVYGIVKQNDGLVDVWSAPGQGTVVRIDLPRYETATDLPPAAEVDLPDERGAETILLVEDEPGILRMTRLMLERLGYTVLTAATPGQAIDRARAHAGQIHLLMTDVVMPEMNGRDLAVQLQALRPGLKCLFMSGYTADVIADHGVLDEGVHFIQKPFSKTDLALRLRKIMGGAG